MPSIQADCRGLFKILGKYIYRLILPKSHVKVTLVMIIFCYNTLPVFTSTLVGFFSWSVGTHVKQRMDRVLGSYIIIYT